MIINKSVKRILLVEPGYKTKYPPLGLMKISSFHKMLGDEVVFHKGMTAAVRDQDWHTIYIGTLFTFQWKTTVDTIKFYQRGKQLGKKNIIVGGILASLLHDDLEKETGISAHQGLWPEVDRLPPDYSIINNGENYYSIDASFGYTTKGCPNRCRFCAVHRLEPDYEDYIPLNGQLDPTKRNLILLDNNVLASDQFETIVRDIKNSGFVPGAKMRNGLRQVDFNQGVDARHLTEEKMQLLSQIPINPLRIAFDNIRMGKIYIEKIKLARKYGIKRLSNYILFNFEDTPDDFYQRLRINIDLNEELGLNIFSFPMRYIPLDAKDRRYVSKTWTNTQLRGVQCILHATHGVVGSKKPFFERAFGRDAQEFKYIIEQPERVIFHRHEMPIYRA